MSDSLFLRDYVLALRRDAIHRGNSIFFRPMPLFVVLAHGMDEETLCACVEYAIDDGIGDPEDLDRHDDRQTSRLETALLDRAKLFSIRELITIEYAGWASGL